MVDQASILQELERRGLGNHPKVRAAKDRSAPARPTISRSDSSLSGSIGYRNLEESYPKTVGEFKQTPMYRKIAEQPMFKNAPMAPFKFDNEALISEIQDSFGVSREQAQQRLYQDWVTSDGARLRGMTQGLSFGLADEAIGALAGGGEREALRQDDEYYRTRSPGAFTQGEIGGGVLASLVPAGHISKSGPIRALASRGALGRVAAGAATGASVAGVYGYNTGEGGIDPRLANAYEAAKYGAVFGSVLSGVPEVAFGLGKATQNALEPYVRPRSRAAKILAEDVAEGGSSAADIVDLGQRGSGEARLADLNERTQRRAGSAARLGGEGASELKGQMAEREGARAGRMRGEFAQSATDPSLQKIDADIAKIDKVMEQITASGRDQTKSGKRLLGSLRSRRENLMDRRAQVVTALGDDPINQTMEFGDNLVERRRDMGTERGYGRMAGLRVSDKPIPTNMRDPTEQLPKNYTWRDRANDIAKQGEEAGYGRAARRAQILRHGAEAQGGAARIPEDEFLNDYNNDQLNALLRSREIPTSVNRDPNLGPVSNALTKQQKLEILRNVRDIDGPAGPSTGNMSEAAVQSLHAMKRSAQDEAISSRQAGNYSAADDAGIFASRIKNVLENGVRDGSGRRVTFIGDRYHAALSRAVDLLELSSGINVRDGSRAGSGFFKQQPEALKRAIDEFKAARRAIEKGTDLAPRVKANVLAELDRAMDAYRVGAVRSYVDFLQANPVSKGARVFNDDNVQMRERLKTLFDDERDMDRYLKTVEDEAVMQMTEREVLYGSQTASRVAADAETSVVGGGATPDVLSTIRGGLNQLIFDFLRPKLQSFSDRVLNGITRRVADEMADMLTSKDFVAIAKELEAARAAGRKPSLGALPQNVQSAVTRASAQRLRNPRGGGSGGAPASSQPTTPKGGRMSKPTVSSSRDIGNPAQADYPNRNSFQRQPISRQRPGLHAERIGRAQSLRDDGSSYVEIAERMGVNPPVAWALVNREAAQNLRGIDDFGPDMLRDMVDGGLKLNEIVKIIGGKGVDQTRTKRVVNALAELQITPKDVAAKAAAARRAAGESKSLSDAQTETAATRRDVGESYVDIARDMKARPVDVWKSVREYEYGQVRGPKDITDDDLVEMVDGGLSPREVAETLGIKYGDGRGQPAQDLIDRMAAIDGLEFPTAWGPFIRLWRDRNPAEIAAMRARARELYYAPDGSRKSTLEKVAGLLTEETGTEWSSTRVSQLLRGDPKVRFSRRQPDDPTPRERTGAARPSGDPDARRGPVTLAEDRDQKIRDLVNRTDGGTGERAKIVEDLDNYLTGAREDIRHQALDVLLHPIPQVTRKALGRMRAARKVVRNKQRQLEEHMRKARKGSIGEKSQDARARATAKTLEEQVRAIDHITKILEDQISGKGGAGPLARLERFFKSEGYDDGKDFLRFGGGATPGVTHGEMYKTLRHLGGYEAAAIGEIAEDLSVALGKELARSSDRGAMLSADGKFKIYLARAIASPHDAGEEVAHIAYRVELFTPDQEQAIMKAAQDWRSKQRVDPLAEYKDLSPAEQDEELFAKFLARSETRRQPYSAVSAAVDKFIGLWDLIAAIFSRKAEGRVAATKFQRGKYARAISKAIAGARRLGGSERASKPLVNAARRLGAPSE